MSNYASGSHGKRAGLKKRLGLILLLYLVLATSYSIIVPIGRGADEWAHYWYARFIAENGRLPANPAERELAGYKADWPPLYHLLAAGATAWIETDGPPAFKYRADNLRRQLVPALGPEAILHTEDERFPWQQEILIWHLGRFLSILFSAGTLVVTYFIGVEVFGVSLSQPTGANLADGDSTPSEPPPARGRSLTAPLLRGIKGGRIAAKLYSQTLKLVRLRVPPQVLALAAVAVLAFNPRFLFTGMLFSYDSLTLLLASLFLWLAIRVAKGCHARWGFWGLGLLAGLALVTKYLAALLPLEILLLAFVRKQQVGNVGSNSTQDARRSSFKQRLQRWRIVPLVQAFVPFLFIISLWFGYLIFTFNEIETYGPILGILAPLIRGDASDRTVESIFAWLSGGQAPAPAYIEQQAYTTWQILAELPTTFWGNPIVRPYPLNWFVGVMTVAVVVALAGLLRLWRHSRPARLGIGLLLFHCLLPVPFMIIRLFGARDALEAVQGRHILFIAGPAVAVLLVWGWVVVRGQLSVIRGQGSVARKQRSWAGEQRVGSRGQPSVISEQLSGNSFFGRRVTFYALVAVLLSGAVAQLIFMAQTYPPLLPVRTTAVTLGTFTPIPDEIVLAGGAQAMGYRLRPEEQALSISILWQGGHRPAPEDYRMELALVDTQGQVRSGWLAYQTQARYPTRAWEPGDTVRDEGWLPLAGLPAGAYDVRWRILGKTAPVVDWQPLAGYTLLEPGPSPADRVKPVLWQRGEMIRHAPLLRERETAQVTVPPQATSPQLIGPDGIWRVPAAVGSGWANFIVGPDWPAGDYYTATNDHRPFLSVAENERKFTLPDINYPLVVNFADKIKLLGYSLPSRRVAPGDGLPITLYWQGQQWLGENFVIFNRLLDNSQIAWGGYDRLPQEHYSPLLWAPGEIVVDGFAVPVDSEAPDGVYTLSLGWYREVDGQAESLPIIDPATGEPTGTTAVMIGPVKVGGPPPGVTVEQANAEYQVGVVLGDKIELLGFDMATGDNGPSESVQAVSTETDLKLTLYWRTLALMEKDYTVFIHLRDATGETVAQQDQPPLAGAYPTSLWDPDEIIEDSLSLTLPALQPGQYNLVAGLYDFSTGVRLPVEGSTHETIRLTTFEVTQQDR